MENWAETRVHLDQVLELERTRANQRRHHQRQQLLQKGKRLQRMLRQPGQWLLSTLLYVWKPV